ncbi:RluA family pseudouridine synthase [Eubacteriales bacterium OttesenSCG-928-N13]|nr:RluA family pseudouridine synthase [Eubacteriales bacterium OttesenSCG-928-N13]
MKEYEIAAKDDGKRLDRWLKNQFPAMPVSLAQKYLRLKKIKLNGKPAKQDTHVASGDKVALYVSDELLVQTKKTDVLLSRFAPRLSILYEDDQIMLVDKQPGLLVHPDDNEKLNTLVTHVRAYLYQKGTYDSQDPSSFSPVPCNRIDRFTGGIVMVAKTREAMQILNQKIRQREITKQYLCIALGQLRPRQGMLEGYILKSETSSRVQVLSKSAPDAQHAQTRYQTLRAEGQLSLVECELITGRTHQIRAQFAAAGHPLLGDGQYGDPEMNRRYQRSQQALYAYKITFDFASDAGALSYLGGQTFEVLHVPFVQVYFPQE